MSLSDQINEDIKTAMKARAADRLMVLRQLKSAFGYAAIEQKTDSLGDADAIKVIQKEAKKRKEAAEQFANGGRPEQSATELAELKILEEYLPQALTPEELKALVKECIAETGATSKKEMGLVMKAASAKAAGRADGKALSGLVARLLA
jgi:uncharacterized protein